MTTPLTRNLTPSTTTYQIASNCIPVKGAMRTLICDVQRQRGRLIPNAFYEFILKIDRRPISVIEKEHHQDVWQIIQRNMNQLQLEGFARWTSLTQQFPPLSLGWDAAARITNSIIDVDLSSRHDYQSLVSQLCSLGCQALQFRILNSIPWQELKDMVTACNESLLRHVEIILPLNGSWSEQELTELCVSQPRINKITVYNSPQKRKTRVGASLTFVEFVTGSFRPDSCGQVHEQMFSFHISHVTESMHFNSCLNRKLSIDSKGMIRNCPSTSEGYGDSATTPLLEGYRNVNFARYNFITKDEVEVCKDCEFRYVCTDCRVFVDGDGPDGSTSKLGKPSKCKYDPYTARWS